MNGLPVLSGWLTAGVLPNGSDRQLHTTALPSVTILGVPQMIRMYRVNTALLQHRYRRSVVPHMLTKRIAGTVVLTNQVACIVIREQRTRGRGFPYPLALTVMLIACRCSGIYRGESPPIVVAVVVNAFPEF